MCSPCMECSSAQQRLTHTTMHCTQFYWQLNSDFQVLFAVVFFLVLFAITVHPGRNAANAMVEGEPTVDQMSSWDALDQQLKDFDFDLGQLDHAPATVMPKSESKVPEADSDSWDASMSALLEEAGHGDTLVRPDADDFQSFLQKTMQETQKDSAAPISSEPSLGDPAVHDSWEDVANEANKHQENLSQLTDEAEACRSSSSDEDEVGTDHTHPDSAITWWAKLLKEHTVQETIPDLQGQAKILSSCTGASSESFVLEARRWCEKT